jgi:hypothetical protein
MFQSQLKACEIIFWLFCFATFLMTEREDLWVIIRCKKLAVQYEPVVINWLKIS